MRNPRIHTSEPLQANSQITLTGQANHYLARVLRVSVGDSLTLFNGDGFDYRGEVIAAARQSITISVDEAHDPANESPLKITLVQAISRGERMDYCLQKAAELGVAEIRLVTSSRVEVRLNAKRLERRMSHWQAVVNSACEQSGRAKVPKVHAPRPLGDWLRSCEGGQRIVLDPLAQDRLSARRPDSDTLSMLIGPEGGFSKEEMLQIRQHGVEPVSLGPRVLRTETAGPAAIAVLQAVAGDL